MKTQLNFKRAKMLAICLTVLLCAGLTGCKEDSRRFSAKDSAGNEWHNLKSGNSGWGWDSFTTEDGKRLVLRGDYSYIEE